MNSYEMGEVEKQKEKRKCACCKKRILLGKFCWDCRKNIPYKFKGTVDEKCNEILRNKHLKSIFSKTKQIGNISFDMTHNIFCIGNEYHKISELSNFGIYESNCRVKDDVSGYILIYVDIMLLYEIKDQKCKERRIMTARCKLKKKGGKCEIASPKELAEIENLMRTMQSSEYKKAVDVLNLIDYMNESQK